jgi:secreted PhoX family phosphatase
MNSSNASIGLSARGRSTANPATIAIYSTTALSVARYNTDGTLDWLPLVRDHGPLNGQTGFEAKPMF